MWQALCLYTFLINEAMHSLGLGRFRVQLNVMKPSTLRWIQIYNAPQTSMLITMYPDHLKYILCTQNTYEDWNGLLWIYTKLTSTDFIKPLYLKFKLRTYVNIRRAASFITGDCEFAHWNRNCRNSGHKLFPSSSRRFRAISDTTSQNFRLMESDCSDCITINKRSFNCCWASSGSCESIHSIN